MSGWFKEPIPFKSHCTQIGLEISPWGGGTCAWKSRLLVSVVQGWGTKPPPCMVMGTSLQSADCCSGLLAALHQWDTVRKKQRYAFLIHFPPGIYKMCCFVGNLLGLFLIAVWDVRKHSDFRPCTVAEFTFP